MLVDSDTQITYVSCRVCTMSQSAMGREMCETPEVDCDCVSHVHAIGSSGRCKWGHNSRLEPVRRLMSARSCRAYVPGHDARPFSILPRLCSCRLYAPCMGR